MVSPTIFRKPNQDKVKRILSKGTKNDPKSGLKPVQKHRDHNIEKHGKITSKGLEKGMNEPQPNDTIATASNKEKHAYKHDFYGSDTGLRDFSRSVPYGGYGAPSQFLPLQHPSSFQLIPQRPDAFYPSYAPQFPWVSPSDMQKSRDCNDVSLFSLRGATTSNAKASAKYKSPWNKPHDANIQTPSDSDINITAVTTRNANVD